MSKATSIAWTDRSSNPLRYRNAEGEDVWGCVKISPGCVNCYSEAIALRFDKGQAFTAANMRKLTPYIREKELRELLSTNKTPAGSKVFVCDMTDLFGDWVPFELIHQLFAVMGQRPDVVFQVLTKRPERMGEFFGPLRCMPNIWCGTSVESQEQADKRIPHLLKVPAAVRFLSCEPLIGPVDLSYHFGVADQHGEPSGPRCDPDGTNAIKWVITGGESGDNYRDCDPQWQTDIVQQCEEAGVAVFVKQDSARKPGQQGRIPLTVWQHKEFPR